MFAGQVASDEIVLECPMGSTAMYLDNIEIVEAGTTLLCFNMISH